MKLEQTIKRIETDTTYNLTEMRERKMFWWATNDHRTYKRIVDSDHTNTLKVKVTGSGRRSEHHIKGANIIKFITKYGDGLAMGSPRKNQHNEKINESETAKAKDKASVST